MHKGLNTAGLQELNINKKKYFQNKIHMYFKLQAPSNIDAISIQYRNTYGFLVCSCFSDVSTSN